VNEPRIILTERFDRTMNDSDGALPQPQSTRLREIKIGTRPTIPEFKEFDPSLTPRYRHHWYGLDVIDELDKGFNVIGMADGNYCDPGRPDAEVFAQIAVIDSNRTCRSLLFDGDRFAADPESVFIIIDGRPFLIPTLGDREWMRELLSSAAA
jgi:hypothetical protein